MIKLTLFTPAGVLRNGIGLRAAAKRLAGLGFDVTIDASALKKCQRFGGDDATRLAAIHRVAEQAPGVALATRGGYGLTRLLDRIDWRLLARSIKQGTRWVGHSDVTALHLGLLAHAKVPGTVGWAGLLAVDDFGRDNVDDVTEGCFVEAMQGVLDAIGFRTEEGFHGLSVTGTLWGGNLSLVCAMLGTRHWPNIQGGVLFLEDVSEHPYRVERCLLQLHQAGVLGKQKAIVLGAFNNYNKSPLDRGYTLKSAVQQLRSVCKVPILTGLPFGHIPTKVSLPVGARAQLLVNGRDALIAW
ncbi:MAG: LD-carboxypeptidase [Betaproteobacteria bacterium]|nr:LD-carboxypeptidase [Betaproteobacteria bacterium]